MTLDTKIGIASADLDPKVVFDFCRQIIGANEVHPYKHEEFPTWGRPHWSNNPGIGLPGWLFVYYQPGFIEVSIDTAYGYKAKNGASCSDFHAWFVVQLGNWLNELGYVWFWENEFKGEWYRGFDPGEDEDSWAMECLRNLGDYELGALERSVVVL